MNKKTFKQTAILYWLNITTSLETTHHNLTETNLHQGTSGRKYGDSQITANNIKNFTCETDVIVYLACGKNANYFVNTSQCNT